MSLRGSWASDTAGSLRGNALGAASVIGASKAVQNGPPNSERPLIHPLACQFLLLGLVPRIAHAAAAASGCFSRMRSDRYAAHRAALSDTDERRRSVAWHKWVYPRVRAKRASARARWYVCVHAHTACCVVCFVGEYMLFICL